MNALLADEARGRMHAQLAALERAGVPPAQALAMLQLPPAWALAAQRAASALQNGQSLPRALADARLVSPLEHAVLCAAVRGGSPALAHERLGAAASAAAARWKQTRARLLMPAGVLALALFLQPLPAWISGWMGSGEYLLRSLGSLLLLGAVCAWLAQLLRGWQADTPLHRALEALLLRLPVLGPLALRAARQRWMENLALLLEAGVPAVEATAAAADTMYLARLREAAQRLPPLLQGGAALVDAVRSIGGLLDDTTIGMLAAGEASGRLPELLSRHAAAEARAIADAQQQLATWLPRIGYLLVAAWMAQGLLGSGAFSGPGAL